MVIPTTYPSAFVSLLPGPLYRKSRYLRGGATQPNQFNFQAGHLVSAMTTFVPGGGIPAAYHRPQDSLHTAHVKMDNIP